MHIEGKVADLHLFSRNVKWQLEADTGFRLNGFEILEKITI